MKVLMIGGSGIISSEIVYRLTSAGHDVYMINRGKRKKLIDPRANLIIADVRNESVEVIHEKICNNYYDVVVDFISFTVEQLKKSLQFTDGLYKQFMFISSATAYAETGEIISEKTRLKNDNWKYAADKIICEHYLEEYFSGKQECYTIVRPYVTYGKTRFPFAMLPVEHWSLANRILMGKPIVLWDDGNAVCTLTHSKEFAVGFIGLMLNPNAFNESFHITSRFTYSWKEVLEIIGTALNTKPIIVNIPKEFIRENLPQYADEVYGDKGRTMIFDPSKIEKTVPEFSCKIEFGAGIAETVSFYNDNPEMQVINSGWDADMDWLISRYYTMRREKNPYSRTLHYKKGRDTSLKSYAKYIKHRYTLLRKI